MRKAKPSRQKQFTAIIRRSMLEYVAICLELNVSARGTDLADVEQNLLAAIEEYLKDVRLNPETVVEPIPTRELIEFLRDTEARPNSRPGKKTVLLPLEVHEVAAYA
jgi:hypothetical protein